MITTTTMAMEFFFPCCHDLPRCNECQDAIILWYGVDQKKVNFVLDQLETCGFLHGAQHVSNNISIVIFDIANLWLFLLYFMGIFGAYIFEVVKNESELILSDSTCIGHSINNIFCYCLCTCFKKNIKKGQKFCNV